VIEPPECRPSENQVIRANLAQAIQFPNCCFVVGGWPPVLTITFQEWHSGATVERGARSPVVFIHQYKRAAPWHYSPDLFN
jgi:hypothetical protein